MWYMLYEFFIEFCLYLLDVGFGIVDDHLAARTIALLAQVIDEATVADCKNEKKERERVSEIRCV